MHQHSLQYSVRGLVVFKCSRAALTRCSTVTWDHTAAKRAVGENHETPHWGPSTGAGIKLRPGFLGFACAQPCSLLNLATWLGSWLVWTCLFIIVIFLFIWRLDKGKTRLNREIE